MYVRIAMGVGDEHMIACVARIRRFATPEALTAELRTISERFGVLVLEGFLFGHGDASCGSRLDATTKNTSGVGKM
jgi:hypothetical protein